MTKFSAILFITFCSIISSCQFSKGVKKDLMTGLSTSYNGLTIEDIYLTTEDGQRLKNNSITLGSNIMIEIIGVDYFVEKDSKVFTGCTIILTDKSGKEILNLPDAFSGLPGTPASEVRVLQAKLNTGDPMLVGETYHLYVRFFDKNKKENEIVANVDLVMKE